MSFSAKILTWVFSSRCQPKIFHFCWNLRLRIIIFRRCSGILLDHKCRKVLLVLTSFSPTCLIFPSKCQLIAFYLLISQNQSAFLIFRILCKRIIFRRAERNIFAQGHVKMISFVSVCENPLRFWIFKPKISTPICRIILIFRCTLRYLDNLSFPKVSLVSSNFSSFACYQFFVIWNMDRWTGFRSLSAYVSIFCYIFKSKIQCPKLFVSISSTFWLFWFLQKR